MNLDRPLIIVGTGRCGSSVLHRILSQHPRMAWLSQVSARFPKRPGLSRVALELVDLPIVGRWVRKRVRPSEAYAFWDHHFPHFRRPGRDLSRDDADPRVADSLRRALAGVPTVRRRRLLLKITGWPRIGFLAEVLPDARFVHLHRDGRAVANSLLRRPWWGGTDGVRSSIVQRLSAEQRERWERGGGSPLLLAGLEWETMLHALERARGQIPARHLLEISYEVLCADPVSTLRKILRFADLEWTIHLDQALARKPLVSANFKWREMVDDVERWQLERAIGETLRRYGYVSNLTQRTSEKAPGKRIYAPLPPP